MSLFALADRVAIVTGSSRGIGRAIAERLAEQGARVVISSRTLAECRSVADAINAANGAGRAIAVEANISSKEGLSRLVERTHESFGRVDILGEPRNRPLGAGAYSAVPLGAAFGRSDRHPDREGSARRQPEPHRRRTLR